MTQCSYFHNQCTLCQDQGRQTHEKHPFRLGASPLQGVRVLTVGDKFPPFDLTACVSLEKGREFEQIDHKTYEGKWKIVFA